MTVMDAALIGTVAALAVAMIGMSWRMPRAIKKSADETNARIDAAVRDLSAKGDAMARDLGAKIDTTNALVADIRERVAYLEGRADPPPKAA